MSEEERKRRLKEIRAAAADLADNGYLFASQPVERIRFLIEELDRVTAELGGSLRAEREAQADRDEAQIRAMNKQGELNAALEQVRALRGVAVPAITEAALVVETLLAGDRTKPYTEIGESLRAQLPKAAGALRAAAKALAATAKGEKP